MTVTLYGDNKVTTLKQIITDLLGVRLGMFANEETAIWTTPPIPPEFGQGVHCIIQRHSQRIGNGGRFQWQISLIFVPHSEAADEINLDKFDSCLWLMRRRFPVAQEIHQKYQDFYPQVTFILIYNSEAYN